MFRAVYVERTWRCALFPVHPEVISGDALGPRVWAKDARHTLFRIKESIHVDAPIERCFLLSTSIDLVRQTICMTPSEGKRDGLIAGDDRLVWRGWKFGIPVHHETLITAYRCPTFFQDTMGRGMFRHFQHDHHFEFVDGQTLMYDVVRFSLPLSRPGRLVGRRILAPHVLKLMLRRFQMLKRLAEGDAWEQYITDPADRALARGTRAPDSVKQALGDMR